jgi:hypothetical protein
MVLAKSKPVQSTSGAVIDSKMSLEMIHQQLEEVELSETPAQKQLLPALVAVSLSYL